MPVYDPATERIEEQLLSGILEFVPAKAHLYRVFSVGREHERELALAARAALGEVAPQSLTNLWGAGGREQRSSKVGQARACEGQPTTRATTSTKTAIITTSPTNSATIKVLSMPSRGRAEDAVAGRDILGRGCCGASREPRTFWRAARSRSREPRSARAAAGSRGGTHASSGCVMSSGRTQASNCSAVTQPRPSAASLSDRPSRCAVWAMCAARS